MGKWIVFAFLLGWIALVCSDIKIKLLFLKNSTREEVVINLDLLYGLVHYRLELPSLKLMQDGHVVDELILNRGFSFQKKKLSEKKGRKNLDVKDFRNFYRRIKDFYRHYTAAIKYLHARLKITHFTWQTEIGLEDAAQTAIFVGLLWALKANLLAWITDRFVPQQYLIHVSPQYQALHFQTDFNCIITIKFGHIIIAGLKIAQKKLKGW